MYALYVDRMVLSKGKLEVLMMTEDVHKQVTKMEINYRKINIIGHTDRRKDGRTDRRTEGWTEVKQYTPPSGGAGV